ncbi:MAG TPA: hypothetical protein VEI02_13465 [Planctomycetota bacterium]|nr:hypothetical protein [Planctomycetota bacterium]
MTATPESPGAARRRVVLRFLSILLVASAARGQDSRPVDARPFALAMEFCGRYALSFERVDESDSRPTDGGRLSPPAYDAVWVCPDEIYGAPWPGGDVSLTVGAEDDMSVSVDGAEVAVVEHGDADVVELPRVRAGMRPGDVLRVRLRTRAFRPAATVSFDSAASLRAAASRVRVLLDLRASALGRSPASDVERVGPLGLPRSLPSFRFPDAALDVDALIERLRAVETATADRAAPLAGRRVSVFVVADLDGGPGAKGESAAARRTAVASRALAVLRAGAARRVMIGPVSELRVLAREAPALFESLASAARSGAATLFVTPPTEIAGFPADGEAALRAAARDVAFGAARLGGVPRLARLATFERDASASTLFDAMDLRGVRVDAHDVWRPPFDVQGSEGARTAWIVEPTLPVDSQNWIGFGTACADALAELERTHGFPDGPVFVDVADVDAARRSLALLSEHGAVAEADVGADLLAWTERFLVRCGEVARPISGFHVPPPRLEPLDVAAVADTTRRSRGRADARRLRKIEASAAVAHLFGGAPYPAGVVHEAWTRLIEGVERPASLEAALHAAEDSADAALVAGTAWRLGTQYVDAANAPPGALAVVNATGRERTEALVAPLLPHELESTLVLRDPGGRIVPFQRLKDSAGIAFVAYRAAAYSVVEALATPAPPDFKPAAFTSTVRIEGDVLTFDNGLVRAAIDVVDGRLLALTRLPSDASPRETATSRPGDAAGSEILRGAVAESRPSSRRGASRVRVVEDGPLVVLARAAPTADDPRGFDYVLLRAAPFLEVRPRTVPDGAFRFELETPRRWKSLDSEAPFGRERFFLGWPTWMLSGLAPAWVDLHDDGEGLAVIASAGVAVGVRRGGVLAEVDAATVAAGGGAFALLPHAQDAEEEIEDAALRYDAPLRVTRVRPSERVGLPPLPVLNRRAEEAGRAAWLTCEDPRLRVESLKRADAGEAWVLRIVDRDRTRRSAVFTFPFDVASAAFCSLDERPGAPIEVVDGRLLRFETPGDAVFTLRVTPAGE